MKDKINEIKESDLIELFCIIDSFRILEIKRGNEYDNVCLKIKYISDFVVSEYINIFKLIRSPQLYDFVRYFLKFEEKFDSQSSNTKMDIDDYLFQTVEISQEIIITTIFKILVTEKELHAKKEMLMKMLQINNIDREIFDIVKKG